MANFILEELMMCFGHLIKKKHQIIELPFTAHKLLEAS